MGAIDISISKLWDNHLIIHRLEYVFLRLYYFGVGYFPLKNNNLFSVQFPNIVGINLGSNPSIVIGWVYPFFPTNDVSPGSIPEILVVLFYDFFP